jgi:hypothetical protein
MDGLLEAVRNKENVQPPKSIFDHVSSFRHCFCLLKYAFARKLVREESYVINVTSSSLEIYKGLHACTAKDYFALIPVRGVVDVVYGVSACTSSFHGFILIQCQVNESILLPFLTRVRLLCSLSRELHRLYALLFGHL